jgi:hypothetical protein
MQVQKRDASDTKNGWQSERQVPKYRRAALQTGTADSEVTCLILQIVS